MSRAENLVRDLTKRARLRRLESERTRLESQIEARDSGSTDDLGGLIPSPNSSDLRERLQRLEEEIHDLRRELGIH